MEWLRWLDRLFPGGRTYVASRNSRERLYHRIGCDCRYMGSITPGNRMYFRGRTNAEGIGLKLCGICMKKTQQRLIGDYV